MCFIGHYKQEKLIFKDPRKWVEENRWREKSQRKGQCVWLTSLLSVPHVSNPTTYGRTHAAPPQMYN